jgi:hypothetical protein
MRSEKNLGNAEVKCSCGSDAVYRYGKIKGGKQRFVCLMCGRQFVIDSSRNEVLNKPLCSICGRHMNLYKREKSALRFRCSGYPECRVYRKVMMQEEVNEPLHP